MGLSYVIIDDELNIRELIKSIVEDNFSDLEFAGTADSVMSGLKLIKEKSPNIVFLDIELPDGTGFDILESLSNMKCKVIFISAYNEYAIKAFKYSAVDYILKPINIADFIKSVNRAIDSVQEKEYYNILLENVRANYPSKIALQVKNGYDFFDTDSVIYIEGEGRYSTLYIDSGKKIVEAKIISYFEELLDKNIFFRIHKSFLINLNHVKNYSKKDGGKVTMSNGCLISVSRYKKDEFLEKIKSL